MSPFIRFPWRMFWKFFFYQLIVFNLLFLAVISVIDVRYRVRPFIYNEALLNFFFFSLFFAAFTSYRFSRPIHKVILKALRISNKRAVGNIVDMQDDDLLDDETDELSELEGALNKIHKKMKRRKQQFLQAQEESQAFMSAVAEGLVSVSLDEKILYFNSQFAAQFLSGTQISQENLRLNEAIRAPEVLDGFDQTIRDGKVHRFTVRLSTMIDNQPRYFAVSVNPIRNEKTKEIYGVVGIFHDITELKRTEQIRMDFVGNASHELRTPLTSVKGYIDTLKEDVKTGQIEQAGKFLDIVSRNIDRLMDLVNDLLTINTLESTNSELKLEMIHPLQISEHVVAELAMLAGEKNIAIRVIGEVPPFMADARKVEQVLRNLVSNAVKYIPNGKTVQIRWEKEGKNVLLKVIDDGPGIPKEHLDRLFERFYRIDKGRARDAGGTGLGLAIVKHIMQSHGGSVSVKSTPEQGAEFDCSFPVK